MTTFVQIAVNVPSMAGVFDYSLPESLSGRVDIGQFVLVPFGRQTVQGVVLHFIDQPSIPQTKEIIELVDPEPVLTPAQIALAESLAKSTLSPLAAIIALFLPPGLSQQADLLFDIRNTNLKPQVSELDLSDTGRSIAKAVPKERGIARPPDRPGFAANRMAQDRAILDQTRLAHFAIRPSAGRCSPEICPYRTTGGFARNC